MIALVDQQSNLSIAALCGAQQFFEWRHYPARDAVDRVHQTEFYYHAHGGADQSDQEHGHFHVFVRPGGRQRFHHLIGISMNSSGIPIRLFLTNQWVTGEYWVEPHVLQPALANFRCELRGRLSPVGQWISAMVQLYGSDIEALHQKRYRWHQRQRAQGSRQHLSDQRWHVVCEKPIDLLKTLARYSF